MKRLLSLLLALSGAAFAAVPQPPTVAVIRLNDTVNTVSAEYVTRGIAAANRDHAALVVLLLNTPGGLDTAMRSIIQAIFASRVPVAGFVAPAGARAASAGFYILLSCDVAAMAPGTNTGAAHPVALGQQPDPIEAAKMQSDADAFIRSIATQRHRNLALAEQGVLKSESFTEHEALTGNLIDVVAPNLDQLLATLDHRVITRLDGSQVTLDLAGARRIEFQMTLRQRILDMDASLAFVLLAIGAMLIYVEFSHPGAVVPGVAGVILLVLSVFSLSLLPISGAGASLLLLALVFFVLEAKFPSHGALSLGGVVAMALGGILLVDSPVPALRVAWTVSLTVALAFGVITLALLELVLRARRRPISVGAEALVGERGVARTTLSPAGTVFVHGELWAASSPDCVIAAGDSVVVSAVHGLRLDVRPSEAGWRLDEQCGNSQPPRNPQLPATIASDPTKSGEPQ